MRGFRARVPNDGETFASRASNGISGSGIYLSYFTDGGRRRTPGRDTKLFPVCAPWMGDRGRGFTHTFAVEFEHGLARYKDDFASLKQHLGGKDQGGISPPTPAQLTADSFHYNAPKAQPGGTRTAPSQQAFELRCD